jgi:hypothetical protein
MKISTVSIFRNSVGILLLFFSLFSSIRTDAQCDQTLITDNNSQVAYNKRGNRCEGTYTSQVSAPGLELVGLTIGKLIYDLKQDEIVTISSPLTNEIIKIRATGIPMKTYYRMDASLPEGAKLSWPLKDVIFPKRLSANTIGLVGWTGKDNDKFFVPVLATPKINHSVNDRKIWVLMRSSTDVVQAQWRFATIQNGQTGPLGAWTKCIPASYSGGNPIKISLPSSLKGKVYIEIAAKDKMSDQWFKKNFRLLVSKP